MKIRALKMIFLSEKTLNCWMRGDQMRRQSCNIVTIVSHNKCRHRLILLRLIWTADKILTWNPRILHCHHQNECWLWVMNSWREFYLKVKIEDDERIMREGGRGEGEYFSKHLISPPTNLYKLSLGLTLQSVYRRLPTPGVTLTFLW